MKKIFLLLVAVSFTAVSCNTLLFGGSGAMGVYRSEDSGSSFEAANKIDRKNSLNSTSVNVLAFDPTNADTLYLASAGGVYKSVDRGQNWVLILTNFLAADLAIDSGNPSIIYVTGLSNNHGKVVFTSDGGGSWKDLYNEPTSNNTARSIAIDPANHNHLLVGLSAGEVITSLDAGTTWQVNSDLHDEIFRVRYGPSGKPYVLTFTNGLYASNDAGKNFVQLTSSLTSGFVNWDSGFSAVTRFLDLAFDQRQPAVIYLATDAGLLRTVDAGANWSYMKMPVRNSVLRTSSAAVNPRDSNNLYAVVGNTLFRSINGGVTWETRPLATSQEVRQILIDASSPNVIYLGLGVRK